MTVITLTTDFGLRDSYVAIMKGVILSICPSVRIIDISHEVRKFDVLSGAFILASAFSYFPKGTIHVGVVDPGVGTERKAIAIKTKNYFFIGPDNGLLTLASKIDGIVEIRLIENEELFLQNVSSTFHGRDIFAPVAAHIARGVKVEEIGRRIDDFINLSLEFGKIEEGKIKGKIVHIDRFGNLITSIEGKLLLDMIDYGGKVTMELGDEHFELPLLKSYGYAKEGDLLLTIGGSGFVEISVNKGSAFKRLGASVGEKVILVL